MFEALNVQVEAFRCGVRDRVQRKMAEINAFQAEQRAANAARKTQEASREADRMRKLEEINKKALNERRAADAERKAAESGGGKTGRKASKDALENGKKRVDEAREKVKRLESKPNKCKEDKAAVEAAKRELNKAISDKAKSENHAQRGQGY